MSQHENQSRSQSVPFTPLSGWGKDLQMPHRGIGEFTSWEVRATAFERHAVYIGHTILLNGYMRALGAGCPRNEPELALFEQYRDAGKVPGGYDSAGFRIIYLLSNQWSGLRRQIEGFLETGPEDFGLKRTELYTTHATSLLQNRLLIGGHFWSHIPRGEVSDFALKVHEFWKELETLQRGLDVMRYGYPLPGHMLNDMIVAEL